ncbi:MAG: sulfate adenylyltransferase [Deinococcales bacterium]
MSQTLALIQPHGGKLIDRMLPVAERPAALAAAKGLKSLSLSDRSISDVICIATGIYSPLEGFVSEADYHKIVNDMRLSNGLAWSIPITLQVSQEQAGQYNVGDTIALNLGDGSILATMKLESKYQPDQIFEAKQVYRTDDMAHPGVAAMMQAGQVYLGGPISVIADLPKDQFPDYAFSPSQTRQIFGDKGWRTVVAFQTRNPIHRAHEYLTKVALEIVDGLFINPLVGATKSDDIPAHVRMQCYNILIDGYYPKQRAFLGTYPAAMRYAGPREAILHAVSRQNYGCSHIIIGRDHAGVGSYYGSYDAQDIFNGLSSDELAIRPLKFEHSFFCKVCDSMASTKSCPHGSEHHVQLSGTKVREMLASGQRPPAEFSRPEVADILIASYKKA